VESASFLCLKRERFEVNILSLNASYKEANGSNTLRRHYYLQSISRLLGRLAGVFYITLTVKYLTTPNLALETFI